MWYIVWLTRSAVCVGGVYEFQDTVWICVLIFKTAYSRAHVCSRGSHSVRGLAVSRSVGRECKVWRRELLTVWERERRTHTHTHTYWPLLSTTMNQRWPLLDHGPQWSCYLLTNHSQLVSLIQFDRHCSVVPQEVKPHPQEVTSYFQPAQTTITSSCQ